MLPEKKIEKYLRNAKIVSLLSDNKKTRVGCVVVYKNKIISMGHNYENKTRYSCNGSYRKICRRFT